MLVVDVVCQVQRSGPAGEGPRRRHDCAQDVRRPGPVHAAVPGRLRGGDGRAARRPAVGHRRQAQAGHGAHDEGTSAPATEAATTAVTRCIHFTAHTHTHTHTHTRLTALFPGLPG